MNLPQAYAARVGSRLPDAEEYFACLDCAPERGARVNTLKITAEDFLSRGILQTDGAVPWAEDGFYIKEEKPGKSVAFAAGLFYVQEPSAMCAAPLLGAGEGERVLDLCSAPGGKGMQLAAAMRGRGVLVLNEKIPSRAAILSENVERMGVANAVVLCADPASLEERFENYFDKILVDAPCSGEGMFRKEPAAVGEWSPENVERCAARQSAILDDAAQMLAGGGTLVYSTCTFEEGENEEQIARFLARHPDFTLEEERLLLPHEVRGEGHFAARLTRRGGPRQGAPDFPVRRNAAAERAYAEFAADFFVRPPAGRMTTLADGRMFLLPEGLPALPGSVLRAGTELGKFDGKRFVPAHALVMCAAAENVRRTAELGDADCTRWLRGETLPYGGPAGWCAVLWRGYPVSLGKASGGILKNHYPKGLRERPQ